MSVIYIIPKIISRKIPTGIILSALVVAPVFSMTTPSAWQIRIRNENSRSTADVGFLSCRERILAEMDLPAGEGNRVVKLFWIRPGGEVEQESMFRVALDSDEPRRVQAWIQLRSGTRGALGDFTFGDLGGDSFPFNGEWVLELLVGEEYRLRETFHVSCIE